MSISYKTSAKLGSLSIVRIQLGHENFPLYRVEGCPLFRGCLSIEVNGRTVGLSELPIVFTVDGWLLSGVPFGLYDSDKQCYMLYM